MRLQSDTLICGFEARKVRDIFRHYHNGMSQHGVADRLAITHEQATALLQELEREGYVEAADKHGWHELTTQGEALRMARFLKPISRARADEIVRQMVERCQFINANGELLYFVSDVTAFGSYADLDASDCGDIDVAVKLEPRPGLDSGAKRNVLKRSGFECPFQARQSRLGMAS